MNVIVEIYITCKSEKNNWKIKEKENMGLMKWIIIGTATVVAGPLVLPLLLGGNMDGIDGYDDDCWKYNKNMTK